MEVHLEDVAHGGTAVGRVAGKVVFVTGGLPGELVEVRLTERGKHFDRGVVERVLRAHPQRVDPQCPIAGVCGGCDWQHADEELQLELKRRVLAEQLQRISGIQWNGHIEAVAPRWRWRTRMRYAGPELGLRAKRSHEVVPLPPGGCRIAASQAPSISGNEVQVTESDAGRTVRVDGEIVEGPAIVTQHAGGREYQVHADGFWQVHPAAAEVLIEAVVEGLSPQAGESAIDLYCGVGLFAGALADAGCSVFGVEANAAAITHARRNVPEGRFAAAPVERFLRKLPKRSDLVVLDPPRKGAGRDVVAAVAGMGPRAVAYVACDPAALARDLRYFAAHGYEPVRIRGFDLFPQTHHIEAVATLVTARALD